jgi:thymus-specific serine protease
MIRRRRLFPTIRGRILLLSLLWSGGVPSSANVVGLRAPLRLVEVLNPSRRRPSSAPLLLRHLSSREEKDDDVSELYFPQRLDHFATTTTASSSHHTLTFPQRYFRSDRWRRPNATTEWVFLCVGGEGPALDASVLIDSVHCSGDMLETARRLAEEKEEEHADSYTSITLLALEHRYYGQSYPPTADGTSPVTNDHLVYLSSRQAVADLAHFVNTLFPGHRVLLFGGSYPGMLAAWARTKYPHLFYGAVSNSAPVQAVLDFGAYNAHVADDLRRIDPRCLDLVRHGHEALSERLRVDRIALARQFALCEPETVLSSSYYNQQLWLGDGVVYFGAQEDDPSVPGGNLADKCDLLLAQWEIARVNATDDDDAAVAALAYLARQQLEEDAEPCLTLDWTATLAYIADPVRGQGGGLRSWLWQTCTEFGFFQTCDNAGCPFGVHYHPLAQDLTVCGVAFQRADVAAAVQATNEWSGGWHAATERIDSVTGTVDPWSELARRGAYSVPGASHHFWTHAVRATDGAAIVAARESIFQTVRGWMIDAENGVVGDERHNGMDDGAVRDE